MLGFNSKQLTGVGIFLFMIFIGVPFAIGVTGRWDFYFTLTSVALLAIASAGVWLTFYIGRINIGQGAFALIGAYVSAILVVKVGWSFWISLPAAGLFAAVVAILIGLPILRLRGVYFAMITLVLTQVVTLTALALPITNGARGISNIPLPSGISVFGIPILPDFAAMESTKLAFYYTACIIMLLTYAALYRLVNSRLGHLCRSMQQNEELASSIGVNISYIRIVIFAISSFFGGLGGAMFGSIAQSVYPSSFQVADSVNFMLNCFLGGLGYVFGPMLGTLVLYFGWDLLFEFGKYQMLIYSTILIIIIRFLPNGLLSIRFSKGGDK
ncbi:branched-chain amino acid ABC transporter permease [bacterium]|jgi:branched-chain amino acid transport system permease protein|uniref:Branched-chain amino acid ABC transporter, permease protein n=1 Tax=Planktomarina temperata RCA23 TaxID=666509 RepID=A0AAN0RI77_9RHOB|nr:branched-chain amino acid ABC transporter, permease protein [Planktomarina temperata RCA23]MDA7451232.1 branched-chain amino acid ABC transporter permease [Planktomarina temperata]MDA9291301.1 branched-chain amino acid ABC transporter permease [bacterium]MDA7482825.1 branched-chain amino acid ABC transporter permease [Planktomarina temperata]MDA7485204.1 branched-chain amino acid ABC transporter permease [Planktomarina temperata]